MDRDVLGALSLEIDRHLKERFDEAVFALGGKEAPLENGIEGRLVEAGIGRIQDASRLNAAGLVHHEGNHDGGDPIPRSGDQRRHRRPRRLDPACR